MDNLNGWGIVISIIIIIVIVIALATNYVRFHISCLIGSPRINIIFGTICSHFKDKDIDSCRRRSLPKVIDSSSDISNSLPQAPALSPTFLQILPTVSSFYEAFPISLFKIAASPEPLLCLFFFVALTTS